MQGLAGDQLGQLRELSKLHFAKLRLCNNDIGRKQGSQGGVTKVWRYGDIYSCIPDLYQRISQKWPPYSRRHWVVLSTNSDLSKNVFEKTRMLWWLEEQHSALSLSASISFEGKHMCQVSTVADISAECCSSSQRPVVSHIWPNQSSFRVQLNVDQSNRGKVSLFLCMLLM